MKTEEAERYLYYEIEKLESSTMSIMKDVFEDFKDDPVSFMFDKGRAEYEEPLLDLKKSVEELEFPKYLEEQGNTYRGSLLNIIEFIYTTVEDPREVENFETDFDNIGLDKEKLYDMFKIYEPKGKK